MNYLQFLRTQRGLTQRALARALKIDIPLMSRLERGWFAKPPSGVGPKLEGFFGLSFDQLMQPVKLEMKPDHACAGDSCDRNCGCHDDAA